VAHVAKQIGVPAAELAFGRCARRADHPGYRTAEAALGVHQRRHRNGANKFTEPVWADVLTDWRVTWHLVGCS
jgi:hypothetical protein